MSCEHKIKVNCPNCRETLDVEMEFIKEESVVAETSPMKIIICIAIIILFAIFFKWRP